MICTINKGEAQWVLAGTSHTPRRGFLLERLVKKTIFTACLKKSSSTVPTANLHNHAQVVLFLFGDSPASEFYVPTFRNTLRIFKLS